jgi:hypothetical protein
VKITTLNFANAPAEVKQLVLDCLRDITVLTMREFGDILTEDEIDDMIAAKSHDFLQRITEEYPDWIIPVYDKKVLH